MVQDSLPPNFPPRLLERTAVGMVSSVGFPRAISLPELERVIEYIAEQNHYECEMHKADGESPGQTEVSGIIFLSDGVGYAAPFSGAPSGRHPHLFLAINFKSEPGTLEKQVNRPVWDSVKKTVNEYFSQQPELA